MQNSIFCLFFIFLVILIPLENPAHAQSFFCEWIPLQGFSKNTLSDSLNNNNMLKFFKSQNNPLTLDCIQPNPVNLKNKLISFEFLTTEDSDLVFSLIDSKSRKISSLPINNWYDISAGIKANIVLDPLDIKKYNKNIDFDVRKITSFQINDISNNLQNLEISNPTLISIEPFSNYKKWENAPIQDPFLPFLALFFLSFPTGFVILHRLEFLKERNFVIKIPWILSLGFVIYLIFAYLTSLIWISIETILVYLILEYIILVAYIIKKRIKIIPNDFNAKKIVIFFLIIYLGASIFPIAYGQLTGWPTDGGDSRVHTTFISNIMTNNNVNNSPIEYYPKGVHTGIAGVSFLTGAYPAVSMYSMFSFVKFLIPCIFAVLIYQFTNSIFFSSTMFLLSYLKFSGGYFNAHIGSDVGLVIILASFIPFLSFFQQKKFRIYWIIIFLLTISALAMVYYAYIAIPLFFGLGGILAFYVKSKKKLVFSLSAILIFLTAIPSIGISLLKQIGFSRVEPYSHSKYLVLKLFDPSNPAFLLIISSVIAFISALFLLKHSKYRYFSIIYLVVFIIHVLSLSEEIGMQYLFYHKSLRSIHFMTALSIPMNLLMAYHLTTIFSKNNQITKFLSKIKVSNIKIIGIVLILILLLPSFSFWINDLSRVQAKLWIVPAGNERNLYFWLLENTNKNDLILNDHSSAAQWFEGFRSQNVVNGKFSNTIMRGTFDSETKMFEPQEESLRNVLRSNLILKNPWDYEHIKNTFNDIDIKYVYISERKDLFHKSAYKFDPPVESSYPNSMNWAWKEYSGSARIAMYENHPNLELIIRNGNSAIFRVI